ncbi:ABC transporter of metals domain protein, partial [Chlamydia psittaci 84-8471/1]
WRCMRMLFLIQYYLDL